MKSFIYYFLQFTYGILMNVIGIVVFSIVICFTHNVHRHYHSFYTMTKKNFGGVSLGIFTIASSNDNNLLNHELGHSYQNIMFGPFFIFIVAIPSSIRYWYIHFSKKNIDYFSIWFEKQASDIGTKKYDDWRKYNG